MDDWNDFRLVLALYRCTTLAHAARTLGVDHSTAFRRLRSLEGRMGVQLFERYPGGRYGATAAGARFAAAAERIEDEALVLDRELAGRDRRLAGRLRVTASETLAFSRLTEHLARFRAEHPGISVELIVDNRVLSLSRREADVALRPIRPSESDLWGRTLADVAWGIYYAPNRLAACRGATLDDIIGGQPLIGWDEAASGIRAAEWLGRAAPPERFVYRTSSLVNQLVAARAGLGFACLPCYLADRDPGVAQAVAEPIGDITGELWMVTHADLKGTARVRAFFDLVGRALSQERPLFEGREFAGGADQVRAT